MDIEEALRWVDRNCTDAATLDRLRSRRVAKTLADEVERLREKLDDAALFERDACMNLCLSEKRNPFSRDHNNGLQHAADAIRARSNAKVSGADRRPLD